MFIIDDVYTLLRLEGYSHIPETIEEFDNFIDLLKNTDFNSGYCIDTNDASPLVWFLNSLKSPTYKRDELCNINFSNLELNLLSKFLADYERRQNAHTCRKNCIFELTGVGLGLSYSPNRVTDDWDGYLTCYPVKKVLNNKVKLDRLALEF